MSKNAVYMIFSRQDRFSPRLIMERAALLECLDSEVKILAAGRGVDDRIKRHYQLLDRAYSCRPLFYKTMLKLDRYLVVLALMSHYFTDPFPSLSRVKEFCEQRGYLSKNSLQSYFSFFIISGYMDVSDHPDDRRLRIFSPSLRARSEAIKIIGAYYGPAMGNETDESVDARTVRRFFRGFNKLLEANITIDVLLPDSRWLLNRDGGHMLMLALFLDAWQTQPTHCGGYKVSTYAQLSERLSVSSTHLIRLVKEGEKKGYFKTYKNILEVSESFMTMVRTMMILNFAMTRVSIRLGGDPDEP